MSKANKQEPKTEAVAGEKTETAQAPEESRKEPPTARPPKTPAGSKVAVFTLQRGLWGDSLNVGGTMYQIDLAGGAEMAPDHAARMLSSPGWVRPTPELLERRKQLQLAADKRRAADVAVENARREAALAEQRAKEAEADSARAGRI